MKLLNRATYTYLILTIPIVIVSMLFFFFLIKSFNLQHVENNLREEHKKIVDKSKKIKNYFIEDELSDELFIYEIPMDSVVPDRFSTVMIYDSVEGIDEPHRQLETMQQIAGKNYKIIAQKSLVENTTLMYSIGIAMFVLLLIIGTTFIILNRWFSQKTWQPFYEVLSNLENYHAGQQLKKQENLEIDEFARLNKVIDQMSKRINKEFFIHKEFIDIVSHEYQTPLAVISNKAELLLQNENLREEDLMNINNILEYVQKLSRLNRSLLLLSRLDNNQFEEKAPINIKETIANIIQERVAQIDVKELNYQLASVEDLYIMMNPTLANILFGNLLQNAIRHNKVGGNLIIEILNRRVNIYNNGAAEPLKTDQIYQKFKKGNNKNSIGLGMSLVKAICEFYEFEIEYKYLKKTEEHRFSIRFTPQD